MNRSPFMGVRTVRQNRWMRYLSRVIIAAVLAGAGTTGIGWFLLSEGLDRAEKWVSIVVGVTSLVLAAAGLLLGLLTWRQARNPVAPAGAAGSSGKYHVPRAVPVVDVHRCPLGVLAVRLVLHRTPSRLRSGTRMRGRLSST